MTNDDYRAHVEAMVSMGMKPQFPTIVCVDGATVSVQASAFHYCNPKNNEGPYTTVEAGFPSVAPPESWHAHAEDPDDLCGTVYGHLTPEKVDEFISAHGGLDHDAMREKWKIFYNAMGRRKGAPLMLADPDGVIFVREG